MINNCIDHADGSDILIEVKRTARKTTIDIFDNGVGIFRNIATRKFAKTIVPVKLLAVGEDRLVSRSQAKRLLNRFDRFMEVVLDFEGVESVGQAFAAEVFRVFALAHPHVKLVPIRQNEAVSRMITRALTHGVELGKK
jgi:hypothetical protein